MKTKRFKRVFALVLALILMITNSGVVAFASDASTKTPGYRDAPPTTTSSGRDIPVIHREGGGFKISFAVAPKDRYAPKVPGELPLYTNQSGIGKTPMSLNGTIIPSNHMDGTFGIAPIYLVGGWSHFNEFAVDSSDMKFEWRIDAIDGKLMTKENLKDAAKQDNIADKGIWEDIYNAFNQINPLLGTYDINDYLKMTPVTVTDMTDEQRQRNLDVINTLINLAIELYGGASSTMGGYLKRLQDGNMIDHEVIIIVEPMAHIKIPKPDGSRMLGYITPANYVIALTDMSPSTYVNYPDFITMYTAIGFDKSNYNGRYERDYNIYDYSGTHVLGKTKVVEDTRYFSGAVGKGLYGHDPVVDQPLLYRESLFTKVIYRGPIYWDLNKGELIRSEDYYKWGFGCLASSDYIQDQLISTELKTSSTTLSILGQKLNITPNISASLTTTSSVEDSKLQSKVASAIAELDKFANDADITLETLENHLSSGTTVEILKIIIENYDRSFKAETSLSRKKEDITGRVEDILGELGLDVDSLYVIRYMNMLIKNGKFISSGKSATFTFDTDINRELIKYLYTLFIPEYATGYRVLSNLQRVYKQGLTTLPAASTGKCIAMAIHTLNTAPLANKAKLDEIEIFNSIKATVLNNKTSVDYKDLVDKLQNSIVDSGVVRGSDEYDALIADLFLDMVFTYVFAKDTIKYAEEGLNLIKESLNKVFTYRKSGKHIHINDFTYSDYLQWMDSEYTWSVVLSERDFLDAQQKLKNLLKDIDNNALNYFDFKNNSYDKLRDVIDEITYIRHDLIELEYDKMYVLLLNDIEKAYEDFSRVMACYQNIQHLMDKMALDFDDEIKNYWGVDNLNSINWMQRVQAIRDIAAGTAKILATGSNKNSVVVEAVKELHLKNYSTQLPDFITDGVISKLGLDILNTSVDMSNEVNSVSASTYLDDFSQSAFKIPEKTVEAAGFSIGSSGLTQNISYSPIVYVDSYLINNGYLGVLSINPNYTFGGGDIFYLNTNKVDLQSIAATAVEDALDIEDSVLRHSLNYPSGSLYAMSDEIQVLLSDYINDCIDYSDWYWSDDNKSTSKSVSDLNNKFKYELQYRVGMYLDIIKDTRSTAKYYNILTNKELVKGAVVNSLQDLKPDYQWVWDDKKNGKGHIEVAPYYRNVTDDGFNSLASSVLKRAGELKDANNQPIINATKLGQEFLSDPANRLYYPNIFGSTMAYLSDKTYKFNYLKRAATGTNVDFYVGGAYQYPLSFVTCDVSHDEFGAKPDVKNTFIYSIYSMNTDISHNQSYFERYYPLKDGTSKIESLGREAGVYDIADLLILLLDACLAGGATTYKNPTAGTEFYAFVDAAATNPSEADGTTVSISNALRTSLGIEDTILKNFWTINRDVTKDKSYTTLSNIRNYLASFDMNYVKGFQANNGVITIGGLTPRVVDSYMSEELIAFTQYLFDNLIAYRISNDDLRKAFYEGGQYYNMLVGNGAFEIAVNRILSASTTDRAYSWDTGIESKLLKGITMTGETDAERQKMYNEVNEIKEAYKDIMYSFLSDMMQAPTSGSDYANTRLLVSYTTNDISYGTNNTNAAGGLIVNNEVFKYYMENIVALSSITKNLTAVYVADDGEVSESAFITSIGAPIGRYEYLERLYRQLQNELTETEAELVSVFSEIDQIKFDVDTLEQKVKDLSKNYQEAQDNLANKNHTELLQLHTSYMQYNAIANWLEKNGQTYIDLQKQYLENSSYINDAKQRAKSIPKEIDRKNAEYNKLYPDYVIARDRLGAGLKHANNKLTDKVLIQYAPRTTAELDTFMNLKKFSTGDKDDIYSQLYKHYESNGVIQFYNEYKTLAVKISRIENDLTQLNKDSKVYNDKAIELQEAGIKKLSEDMDKELNKLQLGVQVNFGATFSIQEMKNLTGLIKKLKSEASGYLNKYNKYKNDRSSDAELKRLSKELETARSNYDDVQNSYNEKQSELTALEAKRRALQDAKDKTDRMLMAWTLEDLGLFLNNNDYIDLLNANNVNVNIRSPEGRYIFNLTYWEYDDSDSGAVVYLPGNSNAILNPAKLKDTVDKDLKDNRDNRFSDIVDMKAFGSTIDEVADSVDTIASLALQRSANLSENLVLYSFVYRNGSWPVRAVANTEQAKIVSSNIILDQDIPIDAQIIEVDNNGTILKYHNLIKNFTSIPSHVVTSIEIAESFKLAGITVDVEYVALVPAVENKGVYELPKGIGKNIIQAIQSDTPNSIDILEGLGVPGVTSYLQPLKDLKYKYNSVLGSESITGKYLAALTKYDRELYMKDQDAHPILVIIVQAKEPIKQINVIESYDGTYTIKEVEPNVDETKGEATLDLTIKVPSPAGNGIGELREWVILNSEDVPDSILTWSDVPIGSAMSAGTNTIAKPVEGGQTIIVYYVEGSPASLTGDLVLEQNEITKKYSVGDYDKPNLGMMSTISSAAGSHKHTVTEWINDILRDASGNPIIDSTTGLPKTGLVPVPVDKWFDYTVAGDDKYEHKYKVINEASLDGKVIATVLDTLFKPILKNFTTGVQTVGRTGKTNIKVEPDYDFVIWRGYDVPTLASFKNTDKVKDDLAKLGITSGLVPKNRIIKEGLQDNVYTVNIKIGKDGTSDTSTYWKCSYNSSETKSQTHTLEADKDHPADVVVRTYVGQEPDVADEKSKNNSNVKFSLDGKNFNIAMGFAIPNKDNISFYPYLKMTYEDINQNKEDAYVLSTNLSALKVSDYIDIGYTKTAEITLNMDSKSWSSHKRSQEFLKKNGIADKASVLPGGATYTLDTSKAKVYVGLRTWQVVVPTETINYVQSGKKYSLSEANKKREDLVKQIEENLEYYDVVQHVAEGIFTDPLKIVEKGVMLNAIASGTSQRAFGIELSTDAKYYLKTKTLPSSLRANEADLDVIDSRQVRQITYTIKSDVDGNVWVERDGNKIASISKTQSINDLLSNTEVKELDDKTKLVTNYLAVIDRNKGDAKGDKWYNEAWDGISVVVTEHIFEVGFKDPAVRTAVLDPKLCGKISSKEDIFNFNDATKVRSSVFRTTVNNSSNGKARWVASYGGVDILIKNIENMFTSKVFYIPNATVLDNQN